MKHVMLDLETLGTTPGSAILSIGAATFDFEKRGTSLFYLNIQARSCFDVGLVSDPKTEEWWRQQSKEARDALLVNPVPLAKAVADFNDYFRSVGAEMVWSHGAAFDTVLWEAAAKAVGGTVPWKFWNVRDTRTVYDIFDFDPRDMKRSGTHHNALDDAIFQIDCVIAAIKRRQRFVVTEPHESDGLFGAVSKPLFEDALG